MRSGCFKSLRVSGFSTLEVSPMGTQRFEISSVVRMVLPEATKMRLLGIEVERLVPRMRPMYSLAVRRLAR